MHRVTLIKAFFLDKLSTSFEKKFLFPWGRHLWNITGLSGVALASIAGIAFTGAYTLEAYHSVLHSVQEDHLNRLSESLEDKKQEQRSKFKEMKRMVSQGYCGSIQLDSYKIFMACYPPNLEKFAKKYPPTASKKVITDWNGKRYLVSQEGFACHQAIRDSKEIRNNCLNDPDNKYPPTASKADIDWNKDFDEDFWESLTDGIELFVGSSEVEVLEDKVNELSRLIQKPERFEDLKGASLSAFMTGFYLFASSSVLSGIFAIERNTRKD